MPRGLDVSRRREKVPDWLEIARSVFRRWRSGGIEFGADSELRKIESKGGSVRRAWFDVLNLDGQLRLTTKSRHDRLVGSRKWEFMSISSTEEAKNESKDFRNCWWKGDERSGVESLTSFWEKKRLTYDSQLDWYLPHSLSSLSRNKLSRAHSRQLLQAWVPLSA